MGVNEPTKVAVSVADMARMVGLSRARFYHLTGSGVFPRPERQAETNRPFYSEEQQRVVLDVRRRNCGINGQAVLFYARRLPTGPTPTRPPRVKPTPNADLIAALQALGLVGVTAKQVADSVVAAFPSGTVGVADGEVVRAVFLRLKLGLADPSAGVG